MTPRRGLPPPWSVVPWPDVHIGPVIMRRLAAVWFIGSERRRARTATPFDMAGRNDIDRLYLVADIIDRALTLGVSATCVKQLIRDKLIDHKAYIAEYGEDMPEMRNWKWPY